MSEKRAPQAHVRVPGVTGSPWSVDLFYVVNATPACNVGYHVGSGKQNILSRAVAVEMGTLQALNFADRRIADAGVSVMDGQGGTIIFKGLSTGPQHGVLPGSVDRAVTILGQPAMLDSLNMGIYQFDHDEMFEQSELNTGSSWAARIKAATEFLVARGEERFSKFSGADRELVMQKHLHNTEVGLPLWYEILDASVAHTESEGLRKLSKGGSEEASVTVNNGIANAILSALGAPVLRFWDTVFTLCSMFQLVYVPDSTIGYLMSAGEVLRSDPETKQLPAVEVRMRCATDGILPLQQVLVRTEGVNTFPPDESGERTVISVWPESASATGNYQEVPLPAWLISSDVLGPSGVPQPVAQEEPGKTDPVDIDSYVGGASTLAARAARAQNSAIASLTEEYARNMWTELVLASSEVKFSIPLDAAWEVGKRYNVTDPDGARLFVGWLSGVTHTVQLNGQAGEASGSALTHLTFTHAQIGDFTLPGA